MASLTISTALVADITNSLTYRIAEDSGYEYPSWYSTTTGYVSSRVSEANSVTTPEKGSLFAKYRIYDYNYNSDGGELDLTTSSQCTFYFKDASATTLTSWTAQEIVSRTIDADGYCVLNDFPEKIPVVAGTIDYLEIVNGAKIITLTIGDTGSGADIEFEDRDLVTTQPWRLDTSIKFRIPVTWNWST